MCLSMCTFSFRKLGCAHELCMPDYRHCTVCLPQGHCEVVQVTYDSATVGVTMTGPVHAYKTQHM